jgi:two-component sensor histidine kinase
VSIGSKEGAHFITVLLLISEVIAGLMLIFASIRLSRVHLYARFIGTLVTIMIVDLSLVKIFLSIQYSYKTTSSFNPSTSYLYHHSVVFVGILILLYFLNDESSGDMRDAPTVNSQLQEAEVFIRHIGIVAHVLFLTLWPLCIGGPLFDSGFTLHILPLIDQMYIILQMMIPATVVTAGLLRYRMPRISRCAGTFSKVVAGREHVVNDSHTYSLQEVHDRIKNNLQLVGSLLSLQANTQKESSARAVLTDTVNRVSAIATLYRLSDACGYRGVDLSQYCTYLGNELLERFEVSNRIVFKVEGEAIHVPVQVALCFGLMFNEIVSISIRHGFPEECAGCVSVVIQHHKNRLLTISIRDNGIGLSRDMNEKEIPQGLGTRIIYQLAKQMRAEIEELDSPGHGYRIHIPL